tara:strand:- start:1397 stop:1603 length:207 start_codon:yes stop_codon:yes gene_type:complete
MRSIGNYYKVGFGSTKEDSLLPKLLVPAAIVGGVWLLYKMFGSSEFIDWDDAPQYARDAAMRRARSER